MPLLARARRYHRWSLYRFGLCLLCSALVLLPQPPRSAQAQSDHLGHSTPTIQRIRNRGNVLIVGVASDYAPFSTLDGTGNGVGFEPDLVQALADTWGVQVTFVPVAPAARLQSLVAGQVDLIAALLPHTPANEAVIDFSTHYFTDTLALLLTVDEQGLAFGALAGRTVATVQDAQALAQLNSYLQTAGATATVLPFQEHAQARRALSAGQADALLDHYTYLTTVAATEAELSVIVPLPSPQAFGFGLAPGDSFFRNLVDATLQELYTTGRYAAIYTKWFPEQPVPVLPQLPGQWPYTIADLPATMAGVEQPALAQLSARGLLRVGVRYDMPPFGFLDGDGSIQGFEIDLVREFARCWFGDPEAVALVRVTPDTAIPLLDAGQVDLLAAALPHHWPTEARIDFSLPYYADGLGLLVRIDGEVTTFADLVGKTLATVDGHNAGNQIATLLKGSAAPLFMPFQEYRTAEQALLAGQIDGLLGSTTILAQTAANNDTLRLLTDVITPQGYGIGLPHFADELRDLVNLTLQSMQLDGTYAAIYTKWFATSAFPVASLPVPLFTVTVWPGLTPR